MMLHRHFEGAKSKGLTTLAVLNGEKNGKDLDDEVLPEAGEDKPKRGRPKKKPNE